VVKLNKNQGQCIGSSALFLYQNRLKSRTGENTVFEEVGKNLYIDFIKKGNKGQININIKVIKKKRNKCCFAEPDM